MFLNFFCPEIFLFIRCNFHFVLQCSLFFQNSCIMCLKCVATKSNLLAHILSWEHVCTEIKSNFDYLKFFELHQCDEKVFYNNYRSSCCSSPVCWDAVGSRFRASFGIDSGRKRTTRLPKTLNDATSNIKKYGWILFCKKFEIKNHSLTVWCNTFNHDISNEFMEYCVKNE